MADLEEHAFRRDRRFIVRLVVTLVLATFGGLYVGNHMTGTGGSGCAAEVTSPETRAQQSK